MMQAVGSDFAWTLMSRGAAGRLEPLEPEPEVGWSVDLPDNTLWFVSDSSLIARPATGGDIRATRRRRRAGADEHRGPRAAEQPDAHLQPLEGRCLPSEKDTASAQKLGQLQPFVAVVHGQLCIIWANLTLYCMANFASFGPT